MSLRGPHNPRLWGGAVLLVLLGVAAVLVPLILGRLPGYQGNVQALTLGAQPPSWAHPWGTDFFGRDMLVRVLLGLRISLGVGLCAAVVAAGVGGLYGAAAGYVGGLIGELMMRAVDVLYTLPFMFVVIVLLTLLGNSITLLFVGLGLVSWLSTARAVRAHVLTLLSQDFVPALKLLGASSSRIVLCHLLPNVVGTVVVMFTLSVPTLILEEAFLSFLGLGVQAPDASLGSLVAEGIETVSIFWWPLVFPAATLSLLLLALNLLGDGLRQRFDPRARRSS